MPQVRSAVLFHIPDGRERYTLRVMAKTASMLACSRDGLTFEWLNAGKVVMAVPVWAGTGKASTRDPSIVYRDGMFHMVWTTDWNSRSFGYASSRDLLSWSQPRKIDIRGDFTAVRNTWVPELHWTLTSRQIVTGSTGAPPRTPQPWQTRPS